MPGILPMKVIRVGTSTQSRIAQACDRCRSKKIRCDGIRPCCTQCSNVGFECKTSDKLSRRAFPRGYTESLEDRVRGLEAEVRELKQLLDEKDEKIDVLSRIHNFSPPSHRNSSSLSPSSAAHIKAELSSLKENVLEVEAAASNDPGCPSPAPASTAAFVEAFDKKVRECGRPIPDIRPSTFLAQTRPQSSTISPRSPYKIPPRLLSDQYINLFFQEWQPMLPVFHRPSFLRIYEEYLSDPEATQWHSNKHAVAQLYLIFDIAAISSISRIKQSTTSYEQQWKKAVYSTSSSPSVASIQCHLLAQLYYLLKADHSHLSRHRAIAVSMCHQLGLHQDYRYNSLSDLESETRKKVFWCQYALDKFASTASGTPFLLRDDDITTPYPADVDDENLSAQGFSPALPGELTKISSALALFKVAKILAKVLEQLYPSKSSYEIPLNKLHAISDELDQWSTNLPSHLRLQFCKDKPSTNVISCRSPLLSLAYFYIRGLIHRPLVCYGCENVASAASMVLGSSAKHIVQVLELLDERRMNYTFPVNKTELLLSSGFSLLWQCLELEENSKIIKDNQKLLGLLTEMLTKDSQVAGNEFLRIASRLVTLGNRRQSVTQPSKPIETDTSSLKSSTSMPAPANTKQRSAKKTLQGIASRFPSLGNKVRIEDPGARRATVPLENAAPSVSPHHRSYSTLSLSSTRSTPALPTYDPSSNTIYQTRTSDIPPNVNLDYFPIGEDDGNTHTSSTTTLQPKHLPNTHFGNTSWEQLVTNIDHDAPDIFSGLYSTSNTMSNIPAISPDGTCNFPPSSLHSSQDWGAAPPPLLDDSWATLSAVDLTTFTPNKAAVPQSVLSFSEESLTSSDDPIFSAAGSNNGSTATNDTGDFGGEGEVDELSRVSSGFKGIAMPAGVEVDDDYGFADEFEKA